MVNIEIEFDPTDRTELMHPELMAMLNQLPEAKEQFDKLNPSRRKEIIRYINHIKLDETRKKNIERVIGHLKGKERFAGR
jgi:uncharacterized protein YdeI (YjbR/CyaY-like superfamily)